MAKRSEAVCGDRSLRPVVGPATGGGGHARLMMRAPGDPSLAAPYAGRTIDTDRGGKFKRNGRSR
jgi:hypothetical protein